MKTIVILQSNYLPWKGYFDLIHDADVFVFYDDLQYTKNDWRNRNKIKTSNGTEWITVPTGANINRLICEVEINDSTWQQKHWKTLLQNYKSRPYFSFYSDFFEDFYLNHHWTNLSTLNQFLIKHISREFLGIKTEFTDSRCFNVLGKKQDRLLNLIKQTSAKRYISGPSAKSYINAADFEAAGIELIWKDYSGYPEYSQRSKPFEHGVSILDLLFNTGANAAWYIWGWRTEQLHT